MDVASKVAEFVAKTYREDMNSAEVLEGMWLAMQMVGGPKNAAAGWRIMYGRNSKPNPPWH